MCDKGKGYIKVYRDIRDHWIWEDSEWLKWWLDLIMMAQYEDKKILINRVPTLIPRGGRHLSINGLASRWGVSKRTVMRFLETLEGEGMLTSERTRHGTTIKVNNYAKFQDFSSKSEPPTAPQSTPQTAPQGTPQTAPQTAHKEDIKNTLKDIKKTLKKDSTSDGPTSASVDYQKVVNAWNEIAQTYGLPEVIKINETRRKRLKKHTPEEWAEVFNEVHNSRFLRGEAKEWSATFDWITQPKNCLKVLEGNYRDTGAKKDQVKDSYRMTEAQDLYLTGVEGGIDPEEIKAAILDAFGEEGLDEVRDYIKRVGKAGGAK